mmetsp:Transcript_13783/g.11741  ORF Transcript_13783/g.11741 Transcript_13783/m.11741 type:complete len:366 (-) Transcript_13783:178-1275(-)
MTVIQRLEDEKLRKAIERKEGLLKIRINDNFRDLNEKQRERKFKYFNIFQRDAFIIIDANLKKIEYEKLQRTKFFREQREKFQGSSNGPSGGSTTNVDEDNKDQQKSPVPSKSQVDVGDKSIKTEKEINYSKNEDVDPNDEIAELDKKAREADNFGEEEEKNQGLLRPNEHLLYQKDEYEDVPPEEKDADEQNNKDKFAYGREQPLIMPGHDSSDDNEEDPEYELKMPSGKLNKIRYVLFFPVYLLMYIVTPNFRKNLSTKKVVLSILLLLIFISGAMFLVAWFMSVVNYGLNLKGETTGLTFNALFLSLSFISYNSNLFTDEPNASFWITSEVLSIYRFGFSAALSWLIYVSSNGSLTTTTVGF